MKILAMCLLCLFAAPAAWAQSSVWQLKFAAGPTSVGGRDVQMTVTPERIKIENAKRASLRPIVVPMESVKNIIYTRTEFNRGKKLADATGVPVVGGSGYPPGEAAATLGYLMVVAIASGMHGQKHYISVEWEEDGVEQELMLEASKDTAPKLIEELEKIAGPKWMNLERRCGKAMDEIMQQRDKAFALALEKPVNLQYFHLAPGTYRAVLLERASNTGELYLFANSIEQTNLKAIALVDLAPPVAGVITPQATLTPALQLAEVRTAGKTLRVR